MGKRPASLNWTLRWNEGCKWASPGKLDWRLDFGTGLLERVGTGIVGTKGYVVLPTGVSTDVSRDIV